MNKQLTLSLISDELAQASTRKKEFPAVMDRMIPWPEWVAMVKPCYYKGERGSKPFDFRKTRYRGREKLHQHSCTLFALANLYLVRNRLAID